MENQRIRITKRMLREALIRLLGKKPIEKIRVQELCQEAQINRTTFYKYYGNQYDLALALLRYTRNTGIHRGCHSESGTQTLQLNLLSHKQSEHHFLFHQRKHAECLKKRSVSDSQTGRARNCR